MTPSDRPAVLAATTPSQTVGPFFGFALPWPGGPRVVADDVPGKIAVHGRVFDGAGAPIPDALIETWQADPQPPLCRGFGRCATDGDGAFWIQTVKPGAITTPDGHVHAPHLVVVVMARGLLRHLVTRIYFADEALANSRDPVLARVPRDRGATLVAASAPGGYRHAIYLQGDRETVFFDG